MDIFVQIFNKKDLPMSRSQESFNKREMEKKRKKKKKEKREKKEQKQLEGKTTAEFMYVDSDGNLTSTPPDPNLKTKAKLEDIEISIPKQDKSQSRSFTRTGRVKFFNTEKGYGFIVDNDTKESFFVHADALIDPIADNDLVTFEVGKGPKGPVAVDVKIV